MISDCIESYDMSLSRCVNYMHKNELSYTESLIYDIYGACESPSTVINTCTDGVVSKLVRRKK